MPDILKIFILGMILAGFSNLFWGIFVYIKNWKELQNRVFLFVGISFGLWTFPYAMWLAQTSYERALFWSRMLNLGATLIPIFFLHWVISFLGLKKKKTLIFGYLMTAFFALFSFSSWFIKGSKPVSISQFWPQANWLYTIFLISCFVGLFGYGFVLLLQYKKTITDKERNIQWHYIFWGALTSCVGGSFNFPLMYGINIFPILTLLTIFHPFLWGRGILKHGLFHTKTVATEFFVGILIIILFINIFYYGSILELVFKILVFIATVLISILLIKSVLKEVKTRERLQILTAELEKVNEQLKIMDQARAEFISIASHQLRTPPATVKWFLSTIIAGDYGKIPNEVKDCLLKAERTNNSLISLIEDMLNVSRIERGKMEFIFDTTDFENLVDITLEQLAPMAQDKHLELTIAKPKTKLPEIMADKEKLRQVVNNLIDNAIKYTKEGKVKVSVLQLGDDIRFSVEDSGKGMSPEDLKTVFAKYTRGKDSIKQSAGLGLGLYVAKIILEQHKGKIWAESQGLGKGSKFIFTLPIHSDIKPTTTASIDFKNSQLPKVD